MFHAGVEYGWWEGVTSCATAVDSGVADPLDAIVIDLYVGPDDDTSGRDPLYGSRACERAFAALRPGGTFAVWAEAFHESYARRLRAAQLRPTACHQRPVLRGEDAAGAGAGLARG